MKRYIRCAEPIKYKVYYINRDDKQASAIVEAPSEKEAVKLVKAQKGRDFYRHIRTEEWA